jgi:anti-sigma factor RsiW
MATSNTPHDVTERLNALIDGELPAAEQAALADRIAAAPDLAQAYATLARLKACVIQSADDGDVSGIDVPRKPGRLLPLGAAAAAAAVLGIAIFLALPDRQKIAAPLADIASLVTLASLPAAPVIPDLANAGLNLVGGEIERVGTTAVMVAAYRGPRGCRLELRVHSAAIDLPPTAGTIRSAWRAGDLAYELVAFGMPDGRFAAVVAAAQAATRAGQVPDDTGARLREASLKAPPCLG